MFWSRPRVTATPAPPRPRPARPRPRSCSRPPPGSRGRCRSSSPRTPTCAGTSWREAPPPRPRRAAARRGRRTSLCAVWRGAGGRGRGWGCGRSRCGPGDCGPHPPWCSTCLHKGKYLKPSKIYLLYSVPGCVPGLCWGWQMLSSGGSWDRSSSVLAASSDCKGGKYLTSTTKIFAVHCPYL